MSESSRLSPDARAFLDEVRDAEDPTREDEERVKRALDAAFAAGGSSGGERHTAGGDGSGLPGAGPGNAGAAVAKASVVAWGTPLTVIALCAAAVFTSADGDRSGQHTAVSTRADAPHGAPGAAREPAIARDPPSDERASASLAAPPDAGARRPARSASARGAASPRRASAARPAASGGLGRELALLQRAQAALRRGDGAEALRELEAFPDSGGQLLSERRAARVLALCSLGRAAEAQALAAEIVRADPASMQRAALERSCANPSRNPGR